MPRISIEGEDYFAKRDAAREPVREQSSDVPAQPPQPLTLLRILAVPVVVVALLGETPNGDALAAAVFALAALTDGLDGYFARSRDAVTTFGKLMDPLADKLLITAALVSLVSLDRLEAWVAMVIIAREVAVTGLRAIAAERGVVISASWLGKLKTVLQIAAVFALIAANPAPAWVDGLVYLAVAVTVISGADYFFGLRRRLEDEREARARAKAERRLGRRRLQPLPHRRVAALGARRSPARCAGRRACRSARRSTLWRWIVSRFSWRAITNASPGRSG